MTNIHDITGGQFVLRQGDAANIVKPWIRRRLRAWLPPEAAIRLDQQLGKSLDKGLGADACPHLRSKAHDAPTALR
jgi:hypothetical protein